MKVSRFGWRRSAQRSSVAGAVVIALLLASCGDDGGGESTDTGSELQDVSLGVIHSVKFSFLPTHLAKELGYFEEFGLNATLEPIGAGIDTLEAQIAGETDMNPHGPSPATVIARGSGSPVKIVFSPASRLSPIIVAREGIETCEDLEGQTVATDGPGGLSHSVMETFLASCGLDINEDVELFIGSPSDFGPVLAEGTAQAAGQEVDDEIAIEDQFDIELNQLGNSWEFTDFHYQSVVVREDDLADNREVIVGVVAAIMKANRWLNDPANREEAINLAVELGTLGQTREAMEEAYDTYVPTIFPETCAEALDRGQYESTIDLQLELGNMTNDVEFDDLVAMDVCEEAEALLDS
jgi:NitT/TauT family transport system substrate-binding protein